MSIKSGEIVMLSGKSRSGKSSLIKAVLKFTDYKGNIFFNGKNINEYSVRELRKNIDYVSEKCEIFEGTVLQNMLYGNENADVKEVKMALEKASIYGEIDLEKKANTTGINLSGGQRQRIAIARVLLNDAPVIIMDQPTAAFDSVAKNRILHTMKELRDRGKYLVVITHRESTLAIAERVVKMA